MLFKRLINFLSSADYNYVLYNYTKLHMIDLSVLFERASWNGRMILFLCTKGYGYQMYFPSQVGHSRYVDWVIIECLLILGAGQQKFRIFQLSIVSLIGSH